MIQQPKQDSFLEPNNQLAATTLLEVNIRAGDMKLPPSPTHKITKPPVLRRGAVYCRGSFARRAPDWFALEARRRLLLSARLGGGIIVGVDGLAANSEKMGEAENKKKRAKKGAVAAVPTPPLRVQPARAAKRKAQQELLPPASSNSGGSSKRRKSAHEAAGDYVLEGEVLDGLLLRQRNRDDESCSSRRQPAASSKAIAEEELRRATTSFKKLVADAVEMEVQRRLMGQDIKQTGEGARHRCCAAGQALACTEMAYCLHGLGPDCGGRGGGKDKSRGKKRSGAASSVAGRRKKKKKEIPALAPPRAEVAEATMLPSPTLGRWSEEQLELELEAEVVDKEREVEVGGLKFSVDLCGGCVKIIMT